MVKTKKQNRKWNNTPIIIVAGISSISTIFLFVALDILPIFDINLFEDRYLPSNIMAVTALFSFVLLMIACVRYAMKPIHEYSGKELKRFNLCFSWIVFLMILLAPFSLTTFGLLSNGLGSIVSIGMFFLIFLIWVFFDNKLIINMENYNQRSEENQ